MVDYVIGTYNMSFSSDLGAPIGSEKHFNSRATKSRGNWQNAVNLVVTFFNRQIPSFVGFQEMNNKNLLPETSKAEGFQGLLQRLGTIENQEVKEDGSNIITCGSFTGNNRRNYDYYAYSVYTKFGYPTILTIVDTDKMGKIVTEQSHGNDITLFGQSGRPISVVKTTEGFVLVNLHAPNSKEASITGHKELKAQITENINRTHGINSNKLFIVGDFNDPFNSIKSLNIDGVELIYSGAAPKSCCYNFDSSCTNKHFGRNGHLPYEEEGLQEGEKLLLKYNETDDDIKKKIAENTCTIRTSPNPDRHEDVPGKGTPRSLGERGYLSNYRYTGDYVFGAQPVSTIEKFRPQAFDNVESFESDHEFVYATFSSVDNKSSVSDLARRFEKMNRGGVKSRRTRKQKRRSKKQSKHSRKQSKHSRKQSKHSRKQSKKQRKQKRTSKKQTK